ncbi:MAG: hypothetical protein KAS53_06855 [Candidatus Cloacimonetes bacterium]|nr:hypothetical protein [Candidatus Cloacimonadota bacterium]
MRTKSFLAILLTVAFLMTFNCQIISAQTENPNTPIRFSERNMGGPRLGITYIPGDGELVQKLKDNGIGNTISQFGWHFEYAVIPEGGGPSFVIELIPLVGGVEYGKFVPSATLAMGVRMPNGIEFGMGPNLLYGGGDNVNSALVLAIGKSFNYGGVSIPINLVFVTNPDGNRVSVIFGYAIAK